MPGKIVAAMVGTFLGLSAQAASVSKAPEFTHTQPQDWLNGPPLTLNGLQGKVVLVEFWTFDCWNCYRSIPWVKTLEERFGKDGLQVIGVHTPELPQEYVLANVRKKVAELGVTHPVMIDNDYSYWKALGNQYWPAFYLIDGEGRVRGVHVGETHVGDRGAAEAEKQIEALIAEVRRARHG